LGLRRGSGSGCDARHLLTGRSIRAESNYAGVIARAQCGPTRSPTRPRPASSPEPCASRRPGRARFFQHPPRRPTASAAPSVKRPDRARATAAERRNGRGRPMATTTSSLPQHPYRICLLSFDRGILLTEGFQATIGLPKAPPGHCPVRHSSIPQGLAFSAAILLHSFASPCGIHLSPQGEALTARSSASPAPTSSVGGIPFPATSNARKPPDGYSTQPVAF
jgi:hypothetical protein